MAQILELPTNLRRSFTITGSVLNVKALVDWHFLPGEGRDYENFAKGSLRALPDAGGTSHGSNAA